MHPQNAGAAGMAYDAAADVIRLAPGNIAEKTEAMISVYNLSGNLVCSSKTNRGDAAISMRDIPYGAYIAVVETDRGIHTVRFTKDK